MAEKDEVWQFVPGLYGARPDSSEQHDAIDWLSGAWQVRETFHDVNQKSENHPQLWKFNWLYGGVFLQWELGSHGPLHYYEGRATLRWDPKESRFRGIWIDNFGTLDKLEGSLGEKGTLTVQWEHGYSFFPPNVKGQRGTLRPGPEPNTMQLLLEADFGQGWTTVIDGSGKKIYRR